MDTRQLFFFHVLTRRGIWEYSTKIPGVRASASTFDRPNTSLHSFFFFLFISLFLLSFLASQCAIDSYSLWCFALTLLFLSGPLAAARHLFACELEMHLHGMHVRRFYYTGASAVDRRPGLEWTIRRTSFWCYFSQYHLQRSSPNPQNVFGRGCGCKVINSQWHNPLCLVTSLWTVFAVN